jgi:epsilon-lactone hydrolase
VRSLLFLICGLQICASSLGMVPHLRHILVLLQLLLMGSPIYCQNSQPTATSSVQIAADGTAVVTRIVPVPKTISREAQEDLRKTSPDSASRQTLQQRREAMEKWAAEMGAKLLKLYPANTTQTNLLLTSLPSTLAHRERGSLLALLRARIGGQLSWRHRLVRRIY